MYFSMVSRAVKACPVTDRWNFIVPRFCEENTPEASGGTCGDCGSVAGEATAPDPAKSAAQMATGNSTQTTIIKPRPSKRLSLIISFHPACLSEIETGGDQPHNRSSNQPACNQPPRRSDMQIVRGRCLAR